MLFIYPGRLLLAIVWILSPPILLSSCLREAIQSVAARKKLTILLVTISSLNWVAFIVMAFAGQIGGFGTHFLTPPRIVEPFALFAFILLFSPIVASVGRGKLALSNGLVFVLWVGSLIVA